jgi:hypothetical protein
MLPSRWKLTWLLALLTVPLGAQSYAPSQSISAELLSYPLSGKAVHMLQKALRTSEAGNHTDAIQQLQATLGEVPGRSLATSTACVQ